MTAWLRFSWLKTANRMRSIEVRLGKTPIGRVRRRTSRNAVRSRWWFGPVCARPGICRASRSGDHRGRRTSKRLLSGNPAASAGRRRWGAERPAHGLGINDGLKIGFDRGLVDNAHRARTLWISCPSGAAPVTR